MPSRTTNILIIGGTGYVGSRLFLELRKDFNVSTVDVEWFGNYVNSNNYKSLYANLDKSFLGRFSTIIFLAAHSSVNMCEINHRETIKNNIYDVIGLLDKIENQKFIFASSASVYGSTLIANEHFVERPVKLYDATKRFIDDYLMMSNKNFFSLRFGTVCGGSPNFRTDVIINSMVNKARHKKSILIANPRKRRSILGMNDLCRAIRSVLASDETPGIYNVSSFNTSIQAVGKKIGSIFSVDQKLIDSTKTPYDFTLDTCKFSDTFDFEFKDSAKTIISDILSADIKQKASR